MDWTATVSDIHIDTGNGTARAIVEFRSAEAGEVFSKTYHGPIEAMTPEAVAMLISKEMDRLAAIPAQSEALKTVIGTVFERGDSVDAAKQKTEVRRAEAAKVEEASSDDVAMVKG